MNSTRHHLRLGLRRSMLALVFALSTIVSGAPPSLSASADQAWHLDDTFGAGGEVTTKFGGGFDEVFGVALQKDGKIVAVGQATSSGGASQFAVARYNPNGSPDQTFANGGKATYPFLGGDDQASAVAIDPGSGEIVVVGHAGDPNKKNLPQLAILVLRTNGTPDGSFGGNPKPGEATANFGVYTDARSVFVYPPNSPGGNEGRILVAGLVSDANGNHTPFVARFTSAGVKDPSLGAGNGYVLVDPAAGDAVATDVIADPQGRILVSAQGELSSAGIYVARLNDDGSFDTSFGSQQPKDGWFKETCTCRAWSIAVVPSDLLNGGRIIIAGDISTDGVQTDMVTFELYPDGRENFNFYAETDFYGHNDSARAVLVLPNGKIVLVGWAAQTGDGSNTCNAVFFALARLTDAGKPDPTFGNDATFGAGSNKLVAGFGVGYDAALAAALQPDGDIVAAGGSNQAVCPSADLDFALARFTGPGNEAPRDFRATVHEMPPFELEARPQSYPVFWAAVRSPGPTETFDVRTQQARYHETQFESWRLILTKTTKTSTKLSVIPGTTICVEARAHSGGFTTPWSDKRCTATPVDDRAMGATGHWYRNTAPGYYQGTASGTGTLGAILHLDQVWAKRFALLAPKCNGCGTVDILIDGTKVTTIDLTASKDEIKLLIPITVLPKPGVHDVEIKAVKIGSRGVYIDGVAASPA